MAVKTILYIGSDDDFFKEVNVYAKKQLQRDFEVFQENHVPGGLIKSACELLPHIIIIEALEHLTALEEELRLLRNGNQFKSTLVAFICKDREEVDNLSHLLVSGVNLFFIKGCEVNYFLRDCFYMGLGEAGYLPQFALAANLFLKLEVGMLSSISAVGRSGFLLETDLKLDTEDNAKMRIKFLLDVPAEFPKKAYFGSSTTYPMLESYELLYPVVGAWDEPRENNLQQETIDTWLDVKKEEFDRRRQTICVFSTDLQVVGDLSAILQMPCFVKFYDEVEGFLEEGDVIRRPLLYFYALEENSNEAGAFNNLSQLIQEIKKKSNYRPAIVIFNSPSTSEAMRKILGYDHLMAIPQKLDENNFKLFTLKLLDKNLPLEHEFHFFKPGDKLRVTAVSKEITVTSLTEHEVTFYSDADLALFTVLEFDLPLKFFVTIIPPSRDLHKRTSEHHYMGLIHGIDDEGLQDLRRIVNQMIYRPIKEINSQIVEQMLKQYYESKPAESNPRPSEVDEGGVQLGSDDNLFLDTRPKLVKGKERFQVVRSKSNLRSKL